MKKIMELSHQYGKGSLDKLNDYQVCKKGFFSGSYLMKLAALP